jgi:DNA-binding NarL/FixJ family response regulator
MTETITKTIRILLVDDHEVVRVGLRTLLSRNPELEIVGEAGTVTAAVELAATLKPDVVLLDVRLPDGTGFDACRQIQKLPGDTRVLILTSFADEDTVLQSVAAGADGYLLKEADGEGLMHAIEQVAAGQSILDPAITRSVLSRVRQGNEPSAKDKLDILSVQERRVLSLVAEGKTNKEIAADMGLSDKTVKNYLANVMEKLQLHRRSQAAAFFAQHTTNKSV